MPWRSKVAPVMHVPYFSQWETADLTEAVYSRGASALKFDPNWRGSGAKDVDEYQRLAVHACGMACLKMILSAYGNEGQTLDLFRRCVAYGGYVFEENQRIKGLMYAPFVDFITTEFGIPAQVMTGIASSDIQDLLRRHHFFMASVHPEIRMTDAYPSTKGGHLVLVTAANADYVVFHNSAGLPHSRENVRLPILTFERFFAGRGVAVGRAPGKRG